MRADKLVPFAVVKEQFLLHQGETHPRRNVGAGNKTLRKNSTNTSIERPNNRKTLCNIG